jgi:hypothetical protein
VRSEEICASFFQQRIRFHSEPEEGTSYPKNVNAQHPLNHEEFYQGESVLKKGVRIGSPKLRYWEWIKAIYHRFLGLDALR